VGIVGISLFFRFFYGYHSGTTYPKSPPMLFCNDPRLPIDDLDRHILTYGQACLGIYADIGMRWPVGSTTADFLKDLVAPFLIWQACYEAFGQPPPWGERSHFEPGILEFYKDMLGQIEDMNVIDFIRLLARKHTPQGHELCPCGSGNKLRNCHKLKFHRLLLGCQNCSAFFLTASGMGSFFSLYQ
jgi:hypothetical protein